MAAEASVAAGKGLTGTGFWPAVALVKRQPELVDRYAERIAAIDTSAHANWAMLIVPLWLGTISMVMVTIGGLALIGWAYSLDGLPAIVVFYLGTGVLLVTTHGLAHLVVGRMNGITFTSWFVGPLSFPLTGGVKIDYSTYLRVAAPKRAWMHAAGAIVTKAVPFVLLGAALAANLDSGAIWALALIGIGAIVTDVVWSTKKSDWKKFRREMGFAQDA
jgi:hypothetical protein